MGKNKCYGASYLIGALVVIIWQCYELFGVGLVKASTLYVASALGAFFILMNVYYWYLKPWAA